jgi:hypothetical protein
MPQTWAMTLEEKAAISLRRSSNCADLRELRQRKRILFIRANSCNSKPLAALAAFESFLSARRPQGGMMKIREKIEVIGRKGFDGNQR